jgi:hypothetical protein
MNSGYLRIGILDQRVVGKYYKFVVYPGSRRLAHVKTASDPCDEYLV